MAPPTLDNVRLAFEWAPVGLCVSRRRVIHCCNRAFATMFGFTVEQLEGKSLALVYPTRAEFDQTGRRGLVEMKRSGRYSDNRIMRRRNGDLFWCHVMGQSLEGVHPFTCSVWTFEDISRWRPVGVDLTRREREIAKLLATGKTSRQIATVLGISSRTVEAHRSRLMQKLGAATPGEMIAKLVGLNWRSQQ